MFADFMQPCIKKQPLSADFRQYHRLIVHNGLRRGTPKRGNEKGVTCSVTPKKEKGRATMEINVMVATCEKENKTVILLNPSSVAAVLDYIIPEDKMQPVIDAVTIFANKIARNKS